jgi:transcriptional regulator with PAS, ATPase and Fis domain
MVQDIVVRTLASNQNNRTKTAKQLGISRATLWRYLKHDA